MRKGPSGMCVSGFVEFSGQEKEIQAYLKDHPVTYPSDMAATLGLDLAMVMDIVKDFLKSGKAEEVESHAHA